MRSTFTINWYDLGLLLVMTLAGAQAVCLIGRGFDWLKTKPASWWGGPFVFFGLLLGLVFGTVGVVRDVDRGVEAVVKEE